MVPILNSSMFMFDGFPTVQRMLAYLMIPFALLLLIPILLLFVFGFYALTLAQGIRTFILVLFNRQETADTALQKPHFLEAQHAQKTLPQDESTPAS